jgi:hypothetical protein
MKTNQSLTTKEIQSILEPSSDYVTTAFWDSIWMFYKDVSVDLSKEEREEILALMDTNVWEYALRVLTTSGNDFQDLISQIKEDEEDYA